MLIGISGKIGSGKDTIGKIIQALNKTSNISSEEFINKYLYNDVKDSDITIKKFADKLKDIVCLLLNCSREQLEDREFKERELGKEWWYYKGEKKLYSYDSSYEANKKLPLIKLTPRLLLQLLGTECGRNIIHPNIWCNALMNEYMIPEYYNNGDLRRHIPQNWIITDVRFPNEADTIKKYNGLLIRTNRGTSSEQHESEIALDNYNDFDIIINNNGTIENLFNKIKSYEKQLVK